jgi:hypothetical protein
MEIEVRVTATIEVEVDVTVTPVDGRHPALRVHAIGSSSATILSSNASTTRSWETAFRSPRRADLQARIQDLRRPSVWPMRTTSSCPRAACSSNTRARSCSTP